MPMTSAIETLFHSEMSVHQKRDRAADDAECELGERVLIRYFSHAARVLGPFTHTSWRIDFHSSISLRASRHLVEAAQK